MKICDIKKLGEFSKKLAKFIEWALHWVGGDVNNFEMFLKWQLSLRLFSQIWRFSKYEK
jgi:hypothetical protein